MLTREDCRAQKIKSSLAVNHHSYTKAEDLRVTQTGLAHAVLHMARVRTVHHYTGEKSPCLEYIFFAQKSFIIYFILESYIGKNVSRDFQRMLTQITILQYIPISQMRRNKNISCPWIWSDHQTLWKYWAFNYASHGLEITSYLLYYYFPSSIVFSEFSCPVCLAFLFLKFIKTYMYIFKSKPLKDFMQR